MVSQQAIVEFQVPEPNQQDNASRAHPRSNFQNDLKSQQPAVEYQTPKAYPTRQKFLKKKSVFNFQNDLASQQASAEFRVSEA